MTTKVQKIFDGEVVVYMSRNGTGPAEARALSSLFVPDPPSPPVSRKPLRVSWTR